MLQVQEIPLQAMVMTMVKLAVPMEVHGDAEIHPQPVEEEPKAGAGRCLGGGCYTPPEICGWRGPALMLEQPVLQGLHPMEE